MNKRFIKTLKINSYLTNGSASQVVQAAEATKIQAIQQAQVQYFTIEQEIIFDIINNKYNSAVFRRFPPLQKLRNLT